MKRIFLLLIAACITPCLFYSNAFAVGLGAYIEGSAGSGEAEWDSDTTAWDIDSSGGAIGFVLDTSPTNKSNFNYRLNIGITAQDWEDDAGYTLEAAGITIENTFGFALNKTEKFRWWLGPLVRVGFFSGETDTPIKIDVNYFEFGIGAATGLNFNINNKVVLSPSLGFRISGYAGTGEWPNGYEEDIEGNTTTGFFNLAVLF